MRPGSGDVNTLRGKRMATTYFGEVAQDEIGLEGGLVVRVLRIHPREAPESGDTVTISVDPSDVVILND